MNNIRGSQFTMRFKDSESFDTNAEGKYVELLRKLFIWRERDFKLSIDKRNHSDISKWPFNIIRLLD